MLKIAICWIEAVVPTRRYPLMKKADDCGLYSIRLVCYFTWSFCYFPSCLKVA